MVKVGPMAIAGLTGTILDAQAEGVVKVCPMAIAGLIGTTPDAHGRTCCHCIIAKVIVIDHGMSAHSRCGSCDLFLITVVTPLPTPLAPRLLKQDSFWQLQVLAAWPPPLGATVGRHRATLQVPRTLVYSHVCFYSACLQ